MLTHGFFSTGQHAPVFAGSHDPALGWEAWSTPYFESDEVDRIIHWVMDSPDDGEALEWAGKNVIHRLGDAEPGQSEIIVPDCHGRYRIGWGTWPWIQVPAPVNGSGPGPDTSHTSHHPRGPVPTGPAISAQPPQSQPAVEPTAQPISVQGGTTTETPRDQVHHLGLRTIIVRPSDRAPGGFDVFCSGQRLTRADPFPSEPDTDQLRSFIGMRRRSLDLLMREYHLHIGDPLAQDLYPLLHGTGPIARYAAITRTGQSAVIDLHDDLDAALQSLRERSRDLPASIVGVQDLDGRFLPVSVQVQVTLDTPGPARTPRSHDDSTLGQFSPLAAPAQQPGTPGDEHGDLAPPTPGRRSPHPGSAWQQTVATTIDLAAGLLEHIVAAAALVMTMLTEATGQCRPSPGVFAWQQRLKDVCSPVRTANHKGNIRPDSDPGPLARTPQKRQQ